MADHGDTKLLVVGRPAVPAWGRAVVAVRGLPAPDGNRRQGSGFVIDAERGLVWTCAHVISSQDPKHHVGELCGIGMAASVGQSPQWIYHARVLKCTDIHCSKTDNLDAALLQIVGRCDGTTLRIVPAGLQRECLTHLDGHPLPALPLGDERELYPGESTVVVLGFPWTAKGFPPVLTPTGGTFCAEISREGQGDYLQLTSIMLPGHSGGPVLNHCGEVIGWNIRDSTTTVDGAERLVSQLLLPGDGPSASPQVIQVPVGNASELRVGSGINEARPVSCITRKLCNGWGAVAFGDDAAVPGDVRAALAVKEDCIQPGAFVHSAAACLKTMHSMLPLTRRALNDAAAEAVLCEQGALGHAARAGPAVTSPAGAARREWQQWTCGMQAALLSTAATNNDLNTALGLNGDPTPSPALMYHTGDGVSEGVSGWYAFSASLSDRRAQLEREQIARSAALTAREAELATREAELAARQASHHEEATSTMKTQLAHDRMWRDRTLAVLGLIGTLHGVAACVRAFRPARAN